MMKKIDFNHATLEKLKTIKGMTSTIAKAILVRRKEKHFTHLDQLTEINGIGEKKLEQFKNQGATISTSGPTKDQEQTPETAATEMAKSIIDSFDKEVWGDACEEDVENIIKKAIFDGLISPQEGEKPTNPFQQAGMPRLASLLNRDAFEFPVAFGIFCVLGCVAGCIIGCGVPCGGTCAAPCVGACAIGCQLDSPAPGPADAIGAAAGVTVASLIGSGGLTAIGTAAATATAKTL